MLDDVSNSLLAFLREIQGWINSFTFAARRDICGGRLFFRRGCNLFQFILYYFSTLGRHFYIFMDIKLLYFACKNILLDAFPIFPYAMQRLINKGIFAVRE